MLCVARIVPSLACIRTGDRNGVWVVSSCVHAAGSSLYPDACLLAIRSWCKSDQISHSVVTMCGRQPESNAHTHYCLGFHSNPSYFTTSLFKRWNAVAQMPIKLTGLPLTLDGTLRMSSLAFRLIYQVAAINSSPLALHRHQRNYRLCTPPKLLQAFR